MTLTFKDFDESQKRHVTKMLAEQPAEKCFVVGCIFDICFGDNKLSECAVCGMPLYLRPWLSELVQQHKLPVVCEFCAGNLDPKLLRGAILQDLVRIVEEHK